MPESRGFQVLFFMRLTLNQLEDVRGPQVNFQYIQAASFSLEAKCLSLACV